MGANTKIEWATHTFNPVIGCTKVSAACDHCYAESYAKRTGQANLWQGDRRRTSEANWKQPLKWNNAAHFREVGEPRPRVFCASLSDVFDNQWEPEWRHDLWKLIADCQELDWLLLTKRPQNIVKMLPTASNGFMAPDWPWPNVWLGTTVENQAEADRRIPHLLAVPAAVRFLSCEPLLGPISLRRINTHGGWYDALKGFRDVRQSPAPEGMIDWVICGGESGPNARPSHPDWFRSLRDQCASAGVAFHHKQNGEFAPGEIAGDALNPDRSAKGMSWDGEVWREDWSQPDGHIDDEPDVYRVGKKAAGRLLDGRTHDGFPEAGDRLVSIFTEPTRDGQQDGAIVTWSNVETITVDQLPGPMGFYLVAVIRYQSGQPDKIIPLHMAQTFEVQR